MSAAKQYEVIVRFCVRDRKTGKETRYEPGDTYTGPNVEKYLKGVDGQGPLIREKPSRAAQSSDSSNKEH